MNEFVDELNVRLHPFVLADQTWPITTVAKTRLKA
jgi:hypothetical protein